MIALALLLTLARVEGDGLRLDVDAQMRPERKRTWAKWTRLYAEKRLSEGEYLDDLYDIGFDRPEAHVVRRDDALFYAFYGKAFDGVLELRGRGPGTYRVADYVGGSDLGRVQGPTDRLAARFEGSLLLEARPE